MTEIDPELHRVHGTEAGRSLARRTGLPLFTYRHAQTQNWILAMDVGHGHMQELRQLPIDEDERPYLNADIVGWTDRWMSNCDHGELRRLTEGLKREAELRFKENWLARKEMMRQIRSKVGTHWSDHPVLNRMED